MKKWCYSAGVFLGLFSGLATYIYTQNIEEYFAQSDTVITSHEHSISGSAEKLDSQIDTEIVDLCMVDDEQSEVDDQAVVSEDVSVEADEDTVSVEDANAELVEEEYFIDGLRAIVMTTEGLELVVQSDLERPNLAGQVMSLQDRIDECAFFLDAVKQKATANEDQIDRYLSMIQREYNMTLDMLKQTFAASGLTYMQAREQLGRMQSVNTILDLRVNGNVIVPRKDIEAYYNANQPVNDAVYYLQRAVIPFEDDRDAQRDAIIASVVQDENTGGIAWSVVFALEESDIADDKAFIQEATIGQTLFAGSGDEGFELYRLVDKIAERAVPLDECYAQIERVLRQPLYEKLLAQYKEKLFERTTVIYL